MEVNTDIPAPPKSPRRGRPARYPFETMPIGGSFFVSGAGGGVRDAAHHYARKHEP